MLVDGFRPVINENGPLQYERGIIGNTITLTVGDAVKITPDTGGSYIEPADATDDNVYGVLVDLVDKDGFLTRQKTSKLLTELTLKLLMVILMYQPQTT